MGLVFFFFFVCLFVLKSSQPPYVFWLECLVHWHLKWLLIGMYYLVFCYLLSGYFCSSSVFFSSFFVSSLVVWWFSLVLCLGSFLFVFCIAVLFWFVIKKSKYTKLQNQNIWDIYISLFLTGSCLSLNTF